MIFRTAALIAWGLLSSTSGFAAEFEADDPDDNGAETKKTDEDEAAPAKEADGVAKPLTNDVAAEKKAEKQKQAKDDYEEYGPWQVKVPQELRGRTYKLRIGDEIVDLDKDEITLKGSDFREKVDLVDAGGRLMSSETIYVDPYIFDYVERRAFRVSLYFGGAQVNGSKFRNLLQDSWLQESSLDLEWQPGAFGLLVSMAGLQSEHEHDFGVTSTYESGQSRFAATYEWVPMRNGNAFFRKLHFLTYAGVLGFTDTIEITDDVVSIEDESKGYGFIAGNDFMFPIWRFWINLRAYVSYREIEFEKLDFEQKSVQRGFLFGGSYAF